MKNTIIFDNKIDFKQGETLTFFLNENFDFRVESRIFSAQILNKIQNNYNKINSIHSKWISVCSHIDKNISFHLDNKIISGKFMGITQNGHAVININNNNYIFSNGEIPI